MIHIVNDSAVITKTFTLIWDSDLPPGWGLDVNGNVPNIVLPPSAVQDLPVKITPVGPRAAGSIYHINVAANSARLLVNSLDLTGTDTHYDAVLLGGSSFEIRVADPTSIRIRPDRNPNTINVVGQLTFPIVVGVPGKPIMLDLLDRQHHILMSQLIMTDSQGNFSSFFDNNPDAFFVAANFMGEQTLMGVSASSPVFPVSLYLPLVTK